MSENSMKLKGLDWISKSVYRIFCPKRRLRHNQANFPYLSSDSLQHITQAVNYVVVGGTSFIIQT
jgi:hypothetical protein